MSKKVSIIQIFSFLCLALYLTYFTHLTLLLLAGSGGFILSLFLSGRTNRSHKMLAISSSLILLMMLCYYVALHLM